MGTRADFYIGTGLEAEWIGSIAYDGYTTAFESGENSLILNADTESNFRLAVKALLERDDATSPDQGWPWPWTNSHLTDYSYCFETNKVKVFSWGREIVDVHAEEWDVSDDKAPFPDMSARQNTTFGRRSGLLILGVK